MSKCSHVEVCKYVEGGCNTATCKFTDIDIEDAPIKRRYGRPVNNVNSAEDNEITEAKITIRRRVKEGKLDENQVKAFSMYKGLHTKKMTNAQKNQLIDILEATNTNNEKP